MNAEMSTPVEKTITDGKPMLSRELVVEEQWIDYNGHLNMAYYHVLFDRGADDAFDALGIGANYAATRKLTTYAAEVHLCYIRELHAGDHVRISMRILDHNEKCIHFFQEMHHVDGWLAATSEVLTLHVDMAGPKVVPWPADILANIEAMHAAHASLAKPERAGRSIGIRRR
jgi:acyl-CoA thioester hydrolase